MAGKLLLKRQRGRHCRGPEWRFLQEKRRELSGLIIPASVIGHDDVVVRSIDPTQVVPIVIAVRIAKLVLSITDVEVGIKLIALIHTRTYFEPVDLCEVFRHDRVLVIRSQHAASRRKAEPSVLPENGLVIFLECTHRPRVFDGNVFEVRFKDGLDLHREPVNALPLAQHVADVPGRSLRASALTLKQCAVALTCRSPNLRWPHRFNRHLRFSLIRP